MLDHETKRRIDSARDILVGKVPDPKSQVEQITIALIYKFMDDIDSISEQLGGRRAFFSNSFEKYAWAKLLRSGLGGHETLNLYAEAVSTMTENHNLPTLFREIFKNAYLPYREPETLRQFLRIIDQFHYSQDYEKLGDAFEHLLSIMGAQGDAGQFRTPRHIIDFIVEIVNPRKDETVLDPACGTAGFLISAYKHILQQNADSNGIPGAALGIGDRSRLVENIRGYDISPDMVRLSLVNLYLHQFQDPKIAEYDTLTHYDKWDERVNVILANPPFFSPKGGGIRPHSRFGVQSKRSEVLFVDYIASHLTASGRAGVIVPEGILFQSQKAYKKLRENLVEKHLSAVISLPAGVFNPYSGVKTSILILDRAIAGSSDTVAFFKIENDGFDLGAQRRPIDRDDLPAAKSQISEYLDRLRAGTPLDDFDPSLGLVVPKDKIRQDPDHNLSMERYRENGQRISHHPLIRLGEIAKIASGNSAPQESKFFDEGEYPFVRTSDVGRVHRSDCFTGSADKINQIAVDELRMKLMPKNTILFPKSGASSFLDHRVVLGEDAYVSSHLACIICDDSKALPKFVFRLLCNVSSRSLTADQAYPSIRLKDIADIQIPLPPLSLQREIVAEIQAYQSVIDGARQVVQNYKPQIHVDPQWEMVELAEFVRGITFRKSDQLNSPTDDSLPVATTKAAQESGIVNDALYHIPRSLLKDDRKLLMQGDILISTANSLRLLGRTTHVKDIDRPMSFGAFMSVIRARSMILDTYLLHCLRTEFAYDFFVKNANTTTNISNLNLSTLAKLQIPLPSLEIQEAIMLEIEEEQNLIQSNKELIRRFDRKIQAAINRIWQE